MDLPQGYQPEDLPALGGGIHKEAAVRGDDSPVIGIGKAQI